jgi:hypothetical protein
VCVCVCVFVGGELRVVVVEYREACDGALRPDGGGVHVLQLRC